jgi:Sporulation and spore germination
MEKKLVIALMLSISFIGVVIGALAYLHEHQFVFRPDYDYIWHVEVDASAKTVALVRGGKIDAIRNDEKKLIAALNGTNKDPETFRVKAGREPNAPPKVKLLTVKNQIASVEVINAEYLTQKMGSSGALAYLASVTFTLTENPQIKKVNFVFEGGDHAMPGTYTRQDFKNYKVVSQVDRGR